LSHSTTSGWGGGTEKALREEKKEDPRIIKVRPKKGLRTGSERKEKGGIFLRQLAGMKKGNT